MTKKQLSGLLDQLAARLEQASSDNKNLERENLALQQKCENLTKQIKDLEAQISALKTAPVVEINSEPVAEETAMPETVEEKTESANPAKIDLPVLSPIQNLEKRVVSKVKLSEETEYAASVIGKIVVNATESCNFLSTHTNTNAKELVNLILGKTEVLKAEILNIVYSEADFITKKALIDNCFDAAKDYFASVKAQI